MALSFSYKSGETSPHCQGLLDPDRLTPRWEFQLDMLALDILLFGVVFLG